MSEDVLYLVVGANQWLAHHLTWPTSFPLFPDPAPEAFQNFSNNQCRGLWVFYTPLYHLYLDS